MPQIDCNGFMPELPDETDLFLCVFDVPHIIPLETKVKWKDQLPLGGR
jgi:hypothetical protein